MTLETIYIAVATDENFLKALLVMLHSAARNLSAGWMLEVFVFGYQIPDARWSELESGLRGLPVQMRWETLDLSIIGGYWPGIRRPADVTCYYRLFLGETLPESVHRVLFLDADLLVEGDLAELWQRPFEGFVAQAAPDAYAAWMHVPRLCGIQFAEPVRFTPESLYFNAGVQLIDLRKWREERIGQRAVEFLWNYGEHFPGRDQDALNCALFGRWKPLPPKWNHHFLAECPPDWRAPGATAAELRELRSPAIVHFAGAKPWSRFLRPADSGRWWAVARRAGLPPVRRPLRVALYDALIWQPHARLRWFIRSKDWSRAVRLLLSRPWTLLTYPLWRHFKRFD